VQDIFNKDEKEVIGMQYDLMWTMQWAPKKELKINFEIFDFKKKILFLATEEVHDVRSFDARQNEWEIVVDYKSQEIFLTVLRLIRNDKCWSFMP